MGAQTKRHVASAIVMLAFLAFNTATSKAPPPTYTPLFDAGVVEAAAEAGPTPTDIDVGGAKTALGCTSARPGGCTVLEDFGAASTPTSLPEAGEELWFGVSHPLRGGKDAALEMTFLKLRANEGAMEAFVPASASDKREAETLLAGLRAGKHPPPSGVLAAMRAPKSPGGYHAIVETDDESLAMLGEREAPYAFIRQLGDRLLVVEYDGGSPIAHGATGAPAEAWCTELWRVE